MYNVEYTQCDFTILHNVKAVNEMRTKNHRVYEIMKNECQCRRDYKCKYSA